MTGKLLLTQSVHSMKAMHKIPKLWEILFKLAQYIEEEDSIQR